MFVVIEQKEPHTGRMAFADVAQPTTFEQRCTLARRIRDELEVPLPIYVDGMDDTSRALFSDLPSPAFLIDRQGRIADKLPWADPAPLTQALAAVLAEDRAAAEPTVPATVEHRDAAARRLLAAGKAQQALAMLAAPAPEAKEPAALAAVARAAITRVAARPAAEGAIRSAAIADAMRAIAVAWPDDSARRTAAHVELATAVADAELARPVWRAALADLDAKAPALTRRWLEQQLARTAEPRR